jgi:uridylate cyclase
MALMDLADELVGEAKRIFRERWTRRNGTVVPEAESLKLSNDGVDLDAVVLYADMSGSTDLVDTHSATFAAEVYKAYLYCAAKVIRSEGGEITAYDGDRIMAVFIGEMKNTRSVRSALKINYVRGQIVNPACEAIYNTSAYEVNMR